jgi:hypothetical protein
LGDVGTGTRAFFNANPNSSTNGFNLYIGLNNNNDIGVSQLVSSSNVIRCATNAVYRDPAAWYHVVVVIDTTQATNSNGVIIYVNGAIQTLTFNAYTQNADLYVNSAISHQLGRSTSASGGSGAYYDGEMAEINFVDGQALAPTAFGASSIYNQWLPIRYAGTYGTNGFYLPFSATSATSYAGSFNGSTQYLAYPNNAAFSFGSSNFTIEAWIKVTSTSNYNIYVNSDTSNNLGVTLYAGGGTIHVFVTASPGGNIVYDLQGPASSVVTGVWTHIAFVRSGTTFTAYVNGVAGTPSTNSNAMPPSQARCFIGTAFNFSAGFFSGDISNYRVVNGTAVYTANFVPPTAALTAITNTSLLTLQNATIVDNSTNAFTITNTGTVVTSVQSPFLNPTVLTADSSGNANNWTPNNISLTAGSTYDSLTDVPTLTSATVANYAVLNPLDHTVNSYATLDNGNLRVLGNTTTNSGAFAGTIAANSGLYYWESTRVSTGNFAYVGATQPGITINNADNLNLSYRSNGDTSNFGVVGTSLSTWNTDGDLIMIALDMTNGAIYYGKNGTWLNSGVPTSGASKTGALYTWTAGAYTFAPTGGGYQAGNGISINFGQQPFAYTAPSGFLPLNTFNI